MKPVLVAAIVTLLCFGIAYKIYGLPFVNKAYYRASLHPFKETSRAAARRESLLAPLLAHILGINRSGELFTLSYLGLYWVGVFVLSLIEAKRSGTRYAVLWPIFLLSYPTTMIIHRWSAPPDSLTFWLTFSLFYTNSAVWAFTAGTLGGLNHTFMWLIIATGLFALRYTNKSAAPRVVLAAILGIIIGFLILHTVFWLSDIQFAHSRFSLVMSRNFFSLIKRLWQGEPFQTLYSFYFAHWLLLPVLIFRYYRRNKAGALIFICVQAVAVAVAMYVIETTRDFTFLTWGYVFYILKDQLRHEENSPGVYRFPLYRLLLITIALSLLLPRGFSRWGNINPVQNIH